MAKIAPLNQLFQLLHLVRIYGHGFCELSRMLMRKNVNSDVSKDSPIVKVNIKYEAEKHICTKNKSLKKLMDKWTL